jgi:hypothetical protein
LDVYGAAALADFLDWGSDDGHAVGRVMKFEVHAASDETEFEHGASPSGAGDRNQHWLGAIKRMAGDERLVVTDHDRGVAVMLSIDLKDGPGRKLFEEHTALDFRLDDVAIYGVAKIRVRSERE